MGLSRTTSSKAQQVGCYALPLELRLAVGSQQHHRFVVEQLIETSPIGSGWQDLQQFAKKHALTHADWHWVLAPDQYQIRLLDVPSVPEEEMKDALSFRVRDMISYPLEEAVVDTCLLPADAFKGRERKAFAIVARRNEVEALVEQFGRAGLRLQSVDVADMALRNLLQLSSQTTRSGILRMRDADATLNMVYEADLCLNRALSQGVSAFEPEEPPVGGLSLDGDDDLERESLALELQRSLDYFDNQLGLGAAQEMFVVAERELDPALYTYLAQRFGIRVTPYQWADHLECVPSLIEPAFDPFAEAIGGTLRWLKN